MRKKATQAKCLWIISGFSQSSFRPCGQSLLLFHKGALDIPVEMEDPFTRKSQSFFSFLSHTAEVMWLPPHKLFPSLFSLPSPLHWCVYAALSFLSFLITHRSFLIYPHLCRYPPAFWPTIMFGFLWRRAWCYPEACIFSTRTIDNYNFIALRTGF